MASVTHNVDRPSQSQYNWPKLKDFTLTEKLGSGTYATVYKAFKRANENQEVVAIKCIQKSSLTKTSIENLLVEIEILKQIKHENVVQLKDFQWDGSYIYLIMEYCGGGDLSTFIQARRMIPEHTVRRFLQQIASALKLLYESNISHMDLKPQNILLTSTQHPVLKIADFGFAKHLEKNQDFNIRGSPLYMAPEMILRHYYDAKVDLWSVGVILFESLYGQAPFACKSFDELEVKIKSHHPIEIPATPLISENCRSVLIGLLQRNPSDRISFEDFFSHPFVDLEHKPSAECIEKARAIITNAVDEDRNGNVKVAAKLYAQAIEYFVPAIYYERDRRKKELLREKVNEYCKRAEQLRVLLKPDTSRIEIDLLKQIIDLSHGEPALLHGLERMSAGRTQEQCEMFAEAKDLYTEALSELLPLLPKETNSLRKELLHKLVQDTLMRAEAIKDYIKVHEETSKTIKDAKTDHQSRCSLQ